MTPVSLCGEVFGFVVFGFVVFGFVVFGFVVFGFVVFGFVVFTVGFRLRTRLISKRLFSVEVKVFVHVAYPVILSAISVSASE